ncbi:hypothetical protein SAMN05216563_103238 [Phytobacter palmae]|nr:hypothetical protein SAMN05216563_103238 [Phytobacter palmae]
MNETLTKRQMDYRNIVGVIKVNVIDYPLCGWR